MERAGFWVDVFLVVSIVASLVAVVAELLISTEAHPVLHTVLRIAEIVFTAVFTVEYLLRWYADPKRWGYPFGKWAIIDLIAILPSLLVFVHVFGFGSEFLALRTVRILRMMRLARLLRLLRLWHGGYQIVQMLSVAKTWIFAVIDRYRLRRIASIFAIVFMAWVAGANALYLTERYGADPENRGPYLEGHEGQHKDKQSEWDAYLDAYWWVDIYLVSGFDAPTPVTWAARVAVTTLLLGGVLVTAVFESEVTTAYIMSASRRGKMALMPPRLPLSEHVVILGRNEHLDRIIAEVYAAKRGRYYTLVVCEDAESIPSPGKPIHARVFALAGNPAKDDVLTKAHIESARLVIVLSEGGDKLAPADRDNVTLMHALAVVARNKKIPIVIDLVDPESLKYASPIERADCVVSRNYGEMLMAQAVHHGGIPEIFENLTTFSTGNSGFYRVKVPPYLVGRTFRQAQEYFVDLDTEAILPVGIDGPGPRSFEEFRLGVADETGKVSLANHVLLASDWLIVCSLDVPSFDTGLPGVA